LLAHANSPLAGYKTLFFVAALSFGLGSLTVLLIGHATRFGVRLRAQQR
jgi:hypothetical protein